jgi:predicted MFS family arabinose efflux permease
MHPRRPYTAATGKAKIAPFRPLDSSGAPDRRRILTSAPERDHKVSPFELMRDGNYRRLWITGGFVGVIRWLELLAVSIFVFDSTGSAFQTALITFFRLLPMFLLGAVFGAIAERMNRRTLMLIALGLLAVTTTALAVLAAAKLIAVWHLAIAVFLGGAVHTSEFPVRRTMLGEIAGPQRAQPALALDSLTNNGTRLLGPVGGGVLYQYVGLQGAYMLCAVLYAIDFILVLRVAYQSSAQPSAAASHYLTNIAEGLRFIRRQRMIVGALLITVIVNMFAVPFTALVPVIGRDDLSLSPSLVGVLASAEGIGALIGALLVIWLQPRNFPRTYLIGSFVFFAGVLMFAGSGSFLIALAVLIVAGLGHAGFSTTQSGIMFSAATPQMRSRVLGVLATSIGAGPLGVLNLGFMAEWLGSSLAIAIMTAEGIVLLAIVALIYPEIFRGRGDQR